MTALGAAHCHGGHGSSILQSCSCRRSGTGTFDYVTQDFDGIRALEFFCALVAKQVATLVPLPQSNPLLSSSHTRLSTNTNHDSDDTLSCIRACHLFSSLLSIGSSKRHHLSISFLMEAYGLRRNGQQGDEFRRLPILHGVCQSRSLAVVMDLP